MPSYRVGGGVEGAATTLLEHVQRQTKRREDEEDAQREWHRKVQSLILAFPKDYSDEAINAALLGKPLAGVPLRRSSTFDPKGAGLVPSSYSDPSTGIGYARPYQDTSDSSPVVPDKPPQASPIAQWFNRMFGGGRTTSPTIPDASGQTGLDLATQQTLEDLQTGRASPEEFQTMEAALRAQGVDVDYIKQQLGL